MTPFKLTAKLPLMLLVNLANAAPSLSQLHVPALTFLPKREESLLGLAMPPVAFRPAALPVLNRLPAIRLPAENAAASVRAWPAGAFRVLCAILVRASAFIISGFRRTCALDDDVEG